MEDANSKLTKRNVNRSTEKVGGKSKEGAGSLEKNSKMSNKSKELSKLSKDNPRKKFRAWMEEVAPFWKFARRGDEPDKNKAEFPVWRNLVQKKYEKLYLFGLEVNSVLQSFPKERNQTETLYEGNSTIVIKCVQEKDVAEHAPLHYYRLKIRLMEPDKPVEKIVIEAFHWLWSKEKVPDSRSIPWAIRADAEGKKALFFSETLGTQGWALQLLYLQTFMVEKKKQAVTVEECYRFLLSIRGQADEQKILLFHILYVEHVFLNYARQYMAAKEFDKWDDEYIEIRKEAYAKVPGEGQTIVTRNMQQFKPTSQ